MASCRAATATFNLNSIPDYRTYCIIGQGRGGTSMTAKLVDILGIPLTKTNEMTEDVEFRKTIQAENIDLNEVAIQLEKRNNNPVWAWKVPQCGPNLLKWYKLIRNPFWIYIIRDHLASSLTEVRLNVVENAIQGLKIKQDHEQIFYNFITQVHKDGMPILLISYERARIHKGKFLLNLTKFLGINPSLEALATATDFIEEEGPLQRPKEN